MTVRVMDAQPRSPRMDTAEPVAGNTVAKVAVGLGGPVTVTVGALPIAEGCEEDTLVTTENLGEMP